MAAINSALIAREAVHQLARRENWAQKEAGVIVVFAIVFVVGCGLFALFISKLINKSKAKKAALEG